MSHETDVVVIGGGLAGATVARCLADADARVLVIDAGLALSPSFGCHLSADHRLRFADPVRDRLVAALLAQVPDEATGAHRERARVSVALPAGGAGTLWTGIVERLDPVRTDAGSFASTCLEPFYADADALLGATSGPPVTEGFRELRIARAGPRGATTGPADLLAQSPRVGRHGRIAVISGSCALRLVHRAGTVTAVVADVMTEVKTIHAAAFVVAADTIRSPALLVQSGIHAEAGFPVGAWLADHPLAVSRVEATTEAGSMLASSLLSGPQSGIVGAARVASPTDIHAVVLATRQMNRPPILHLYWYCRAYPRPSNGLLFASPGEDRFGVGGVSTRFAEPVACDALLAAMQHDIRATAGSLGCPLPGWRPRLLPLGAAMHSFGTLRTDVPGCGVTARTGRVHGFSNLYVAGAARIPCSCSVNPVLAVAAMAVGTAHAISGAIT